MEVHDKEDSGLVSAKHQQTTRGELEPYSYL